MKMTYSVNPQNEQISLRLSVCADGIQIHSDGTLLSTQNTVEDALTYCAAYGFAPAEDGDERAEIRAELDTLRREQAFAALDTGIEAMITDVMMDLADDPCENWSSAKAVCSSLAQVLHDARFGDRTGVDGDLPNWKDNRWIEIHGKISGINSVMVLAQPSKSWWAEIRSRRS